MIEPLPRQPVRDVFDLLDPGCNVLFGLEVEEARALVASGDPAEVRSIRGDFALVARVGERIRMARSLSVPMRTFILKQADGPGLVVAHRIDAIRDFLFSRGHGDQFHPSYTRMVPAHHVTDLALVGCPDPSPTHIRFLDPPRDRLPGDVDAIGRAYVGACADGIAAWLRSLPEDAPIGVPFSGGVDSGAVFLVVEHAMRRLGMNPGRLKAFTLAVDGQGEDLAQARRFLAALDMEVYLEPVEVGAEAVDFREAVRVVEDYKPLDVQAAAVGVALLREVRRRYPGWVWLADGDGGDENLKDYPIEQNPELTIRSVLNNRMLYHEGWGVGAIKHSLTYSGGLSRGCTRTFAPAHHLGFRSFSPFKLPEVVAVAEGIPFSALTGWDHEKLYALKGAVVSAGVRALTDLDMPVFDKRRFQDGAGELAARLPKREAEYRQAFSGAFGC